MNGREVFLEGMWKKVTEKEQTLRAAERLLEETVKPDFAGFLRSMFWGIGFRQLYAGMASVISIAFVITILTAYLIWQVVLQMGESVYTAAFFSAPLLYVGMFALFWLKEQGSGCYELQMSCKYTFCHVLAARMLGECLTGFVFNGVYAAALALQCRADGIRLFAISFSSLMLFALLAAAGILWGRQIKGAVCICSLWLLANMAFFLSVPAAYGKLLEELPVFLFIGIGLSGMCIYIKQLIFMTAPTFRKEYANAANTKCY